MEDQPNQAAARNHRGVIVAWLLCALCVDPSATRAQSPSNALTLAVERQVADLEPGAAQIRGADITWPQLMLEFYQRRGFQPAWTDANTVTQFLQAVESSRADGLDPNDYHLPVLMALRGEVAGPTVTDHVRAQFDVLLTDSLSRLAYHLAFGKVDPQSFDPEWNYGRTIKGIDVVEVFEQLISSGDIRARIEAAKPAHRLYQQLKLELARYRDIESAGGWPIVPAGPTLKPGMTDSRIPILRTRLIGSGDLAVESASELPFFDEQLTQGVTHFQTRMGIEPDGAVGPGTLAELNVLVSKRIDTLRVNLDRGRVLLHDLPTEFLIVNVAGFWVYLVRDGEPVWRARVQVGKPFRRTPIFRSEISYLVFNPTWTVPPGIIANDILPAARRDPDAIRRKGLDVIDSSGRVVDPASVDWNAFRSGHIPYTLVQQPGPNNALGRVKFMFPNPYAVYLHDTPAKSLFEEDERTFSSGCVRVERPLELAALLLKQPDKWNESTIANVIQSGKTQNVNLSAKMPILLAYWTAWVDSEGRANFRRDIYDRDSKWLAGLNGKFTVRKRALLEAAP